MIWLLALIAQVVFVVAGVRRDRQAGVWAWSKFAFTLAFAALECLLLIPPIVLLDPRGRLFGPIFASAGLIAALNFIWFIIACRRWRLPDGRTSLQAYYDDHPEKKPPESVP
jgi:hypothetical protein